MTHFVTAKVIDRELYVECVACTKLFIRYNANTEACDMNSGPCACGAWHNSDHVCSDCKKEITHAKRFNRS